MNSTKDIDKTFQPLEGEGEGRVMIRLGWFRIEMETLSFSYHNTSKKTSRPISVCANSVQRLHITSYVSTR